MAESKLLIAMLTLLKGALLFAQKESVSTSRILQRRLVQFCHHRDLTLSGEQPAL